MSGYPNVLKYFIWPFQVHYRIGCQTKAESVFNELDRGLYPEVWLIGAKVNPDNTLEFFFDPEDREDIQSLIQPLPEAARNSFLNHKDKNMHYSGPGMQDEMNSRLHDDCLRIGLEQLLNESNLASTTMFFIARPYRINNVLTFVVLRLNRQVYFQHSKLKIGLVNDRYPISRSLLDAAIQCYLKDCEVGIRLPDAGKSSNDIRRADELLRESARQFMYTVSVKGNAFEGLHHLFDSCNKISIHRYEGTENIGSLIIAKKDSEYIEFTQRLESPFSLQDYKKTRKLLQLTDDDIGLICDSYLVYGLGKISEAYPIDSEEVFKVKFIGIHCWAVTHGDDTLMVMRYGQPQFLTEVINRVKFSEDCRRIFRNIQDPLIKKLYEIAVAATKQKNGALIIISDDAYNEAIRLKSQCITIKPTQSTEEIITNLTSIDGGVLLDQGGTIFAYGVILDGIVSHKGDSARGSRFNSAVTYHENKGKEIATLIVVVSEDGMVDVIPALRPQIRKSDIEQAISLLVALIETFDRPTYNQLMDYLTNREFYITAEQCTVINSTRKAINEKYRDMPQIVFRDLRPNNEMNDHFYLPE